MWLNTKSYWSDTQGWKLTPRAFQISASICVCVVSTITAYQTVISQSPLLLCSHFEFLSCFWFDSNEETLTLDRLVLTCSDAAVWFIIFCFIVRDVVDVFGWMWNVSRLCSLKPWRSSGLASAAIEMGSKSILSPGDAHSYVFIFNCDSLHYPVGFSVILWRKVCYGAECRGSFDTRPKWCMESTMVLILYEDRGYRMAYFHQLPLTSKLWRNQSSVLLMCSAPAQLFLSFFPLLSLPYWAWYCLCWFGSPGQLSARRTIIPFFCPNVRALRPARCSHWTDWLLTEASVFISLDKSSFFRSIDTVTCGNVIHVRVFTQGGRCSFLSKILFSCKVNKCFTCT